MNLADAFLLVGRLVDDHDQPGLTRRAEAMQLLYDELNRLAAHLLHRKFRDSLDTSCLDDLVLDCLLRLVDLGTAHRDLPDDATRSATFHPENDAHARGYLKMALYYAFLALLKRLQRHPSLDHTTDDEDGAARPSPHMPSINSSEDALVEAQLIKTFWRDVVPQAARAQHAQARDTFIPTLHLMARIYAFGPDDATWEQLEAETGANPNLLQQRFRRVRNRLLEWIDASDHPPELKTAYREIVSLRLRERRRATPAKYTDPGQ